MEKFVPFDKMSKKEKKKINAASRRTWEGLSPVTRVAESDVKKYRRNPKHKKPYDIVY